MQRTYANEPARTGFQALSGPASGQARGGVLDFVEFLVSRQVRTLWSVEQRREVVARTMGCLRQTRTSSEAFARRKQDERAHEERRWNA